VVVVVVVVVVVAEVVAEVHVLEDALAAVREVVRMDALVVQVVALVHVKMVASFLLRKVFLDENLRE